MRKISSYAGLAVLVNHRYQTLVKRLIQTSEWNLPNTNIEAFGGVRLKFDGGGSPKQPANLPLISVIEISATKFAFHYRLKT